MKLNFEEADVQVGKTASHRQTNTSQHASGNLCHEPNRPCKQLMGRPASPCSAKLKGVTSVAEILCLCSSSDLLHWHFSSTQKILPSSTSTFLGQLPEPGAVSMGVGIVGIDDSMMLFDSFWHRLAVV